MIIKKEIQTSRNDKQCNFLNHVIGCFTWLIKSKTKFAFLSHWTKIS